MKELIKQLSEYGLYILLYSVIFNIIETIYFGWNIEAMSRGEEVCDAISLLGMNLGFTLALIKLIWFPEKRK